jgi:hypothetical protein
MEWRLVLGAYRQGEYDKEKKKVVRVGVEAGLTPEETAGGGKEEKEEGKGCTFVPLLLLLPLKGGRWKTSAPANISDAQMYFIKPINR